MPQLDTVYTTLTFIWTWLILAMMMKKVKTFMIMSTPKKQPMKPHKPTNTLPW